MRRRTRLIAGGVLIAALAVAGAGIAVAQGGDDSEVDRPIPADALDRASSAALAHTGRGRVTDTEVGDEDGYYEVEVTLPDGSQVDVHLDKAFTVLNAVADNDSNEK